MPWIRRALGNVWQLMFIYFSPLGIFFVAQFGFCVSPVAEWAIWEQ